MQQDEISELFIESINESRISDDEILKELEEYLPLPKVVNVVPDLTDEDLDLLRRLEELELPNDPIQL